MCVCVFASKLQSDLKTTKFEEMKVDLEVCKQEILRLHSEKEAPAKTTPRYEISAVLVPYSLNSLCCQAKGPFLVANQNLTGRGC